MADKQIPFSAPMVRALLEGHKTQTRRLLRPQPSKPWGSACMDGPRWWTCDSLTLEVIEEWRLPWSKGDRLYVREAWRTMDGLDPLSGKQIAEKCAEAGYRRAWAPIQYEADGGRDNWIREPHGWGTEPGRYRHARFMPRWALRLTLIVTDVRVQQLQEISEADAMAEGGTSENGEVPFGEGYADAYWFNHGQNHGNSFDTPRESFRDLWNSLHGRDAWGANPLVVAISFDVIRANIDSVGSRNG
ncbi:hypothetical protein C8J27_1145 [Rhodobacter aestuarii]|uniref:Uncharacterized protein n=1 Tax=Rhodobacter aestuarii TaxID=453582 RepID=A0A1N7QCR7_9RHOB|nr:hypothetical protein [Rhodobacter aestuarii]PTV93559.1 hypothetical protein C8J27_1145 [Rhodobacter aestuarii]SIT20652.1 hypothetical protein SAMN05421580_1165 [Rhodobacter aestuarii]